MALTLCGIRFYESFGNARNEKKSSNIFKSIVKSINFLFGHLEN